MPRKGTQKPMVTRLPITKARVNFGAVVKRVHLNKEYIIIEKDGIPIAGLMDIDEFEDYLEQQDASVQAAIEASDAEYTAGKSRPARELLSELAAEKPKKTQRKRKVGAGQNLMFGQHRDLIACSVPSPEGIPIWPSALPQPSKYLALIRITEAVSIRFGNWKVFVKVQGSIAFAWGGGVSAMTFIIARWSCTTAVCVVKIRIDNSAGLASNCSKQLKTPLSHFPQNPCSSSTPLPIIAQKGHNEQF